jgi:hypothetical protein
VAPREKPELNVDVHPWERWTRDVCGRDEPPRLYRIFAQYAQTKPRSLRVALARFLKLEGKAARSVRVSGGLYRASQFWSWRWRADELDKYLAEEERAAFEKARVEARARRVARLERLSVLFDAGLAKFDLKRMQPNEFVRELVRAHEEERVELRDRPEDDAAHLSEHERALPAIDDVIKPPEPVDHKPPEPE